MIPAVSGRIPSDITVRLGKVSVTAAFGNALFATAADTSASHSVRGNEGVPSPAADKEPALINPLETDTSRNC